MFHGVTFVTVSLVDRSDENVAQREKGRFISFKQFLVGYSTFTILVRLFFPRPAVLLKRHSILSHLWSTAIARIH